MKVDENNERSNFGKLHCQKKRECKFGYYTKRFKRGDNVILILKSNGDLEIKKSKPNFWDSLPKISEEEKKQEIEDLGYNPSEQTPVGKERIED